MKPAAERDPLSTRARVLLPLLLLILVVVSWHRYQTVPPRASFAVSGAAMGTTWSVKVAGEALDADAERAVFDAAEAAIARVDELMSTWRSDSELSRFNAHAKVLPFSISDEMSRVMAIAAPVARLSGGAFDVTVSPMVAAWGFGAHAGEGEPRPPTRREINGLRRLVGIDMLVLDAARHTLTKRRARVQIDLSAVAKGFAVDEVARMVSGLGHTNFLVEIGGELRGSGVRQGDEAWRVAIEEPDADGRAIHRVIALRDASMATSGDYRNYYEAEGQRVSHTIDPRSGSPISHALASVTVIDVEAARADAWATALNVLGPEAGYSLAKKQGLAAYFIVRDDDGGFQPRMTRRFEPWLLPELAE